MTMNSNQQGQSVARRIYVHCPKDNLGFSVEIAGRETRIPCDSGTHDMDAGFPHGEFWEYCCDCATFAPSPVKQNLRPSDACPSCRRRFVKRFLCAHCKTLVGESDSPNERRQVKLSQDGAPVGCPACLARTVGDLRVHDCPDFHALFTTTRGVCPLCDARITPPIKFPVKVKDFFSRHASEKIYVDSNDDSSLTETSNGAFALVRYSGSSDVASLLPKTDSVGVLGFDSRTARFFDTPRSGAGEVVVEQPAEVRRVGDKWMLTKHGRLTVIAATESVITTVAPPAIANNVVTCPNCRTEVNARYKFCNRCKHSLVGVRDATTAVGVSPPSVPESKKTTLLADDVYQETPSLDAARESSTDSFIKQPLAFINQLRTQKSNSTFFLAGGIGLTLLVVIALLASSGGSGSNSVTSTFGASTESKLQDAIARGNLIAPQGTSASDYYGQLKSEGASSATLSKYSEQVIPLLTATPYEMLNKFALVGSDEPLQSEWDEAARNL